MLTWRGALQDVVNALVLSECVYKVVDLGPEEAAVITQQIILDFPQPLVSLRALQWSEAHVRHRQASPPSLSIR